MKRIIVLLFAVSCVQAQPVTKNMIIHSNEYYYGEGVAENEFEAKDQALKNLSSQIAVTVRASITQKLKETLKNVEESVESVVETHSNATLRNVQSMKKMTNHNQTEVFCYMKKSEVEKVWDERRQLIANMVKEAKQYAEEHNVSHAVKLYTFAFLLTNSLPEKCVEYNGVNYTIEIPKQINKIILDARFVFVRDSMLTDKEREVTLRVTHQNQPVSLIDFKVWDGAGYFYVEGRDGLAAVKLIGASVQFDELRLYIKTDYYQNRKEFSIVETLWDLFNRPSFESQKIVRLDKIEEIEEEQMARKERKSTVTFRESKFAFDVETEEDIPVAEEIVRQTNQFLELLSGGDINAVQSCYASDPFFCHKVVDYMKFNHPRPLDSKIQAGILKTRNGYEFRRIRVIHSYPSISKQSTDYLVLDFDENGKLIDLNTCIYKQLYEKFAREAEWGKDWGNRQEIIKFLEKYRTAYLTRDIQTVDMMFAEEAIIIVGRKLESKKLPEDMVRYQPFGSQPGYNYVKLSKQEYLERQKQIFRTVQDIFLDFSTFDINRKNYPSSVYGVEMRQTYLSTGYGDEGYLFLLIDFDPDTLTDNPLIYVRAWQPNTWSDSAKIRAGDFVVHK